MLVGARGGEGVTLRATVAGGQWSGGLLEECCFDEARLQDRCASHGPLQLYDPSHCKVKHSSREELDTVRVFTLRCHT